MMKNQNNINRKDALKRIGKYSALTALGTFMILNPKSAQASSALGPVANPNNGPGSILDD